MAIDEPLSAAAVEANNLWLRTHHPDHFFKQTDRTGDRMGSVAAELVDQIGSAAADSGGRRLRRSSGSSRRKSSSSSNTTTTDNNNHAYGDPDKENAGGLHDQDKRDAGEEQGNQGLEHINQNGGVNGPGGMEDGTRTRPIKRRRENGGVLASTCSSTANKRGKAAVSGPKAT
ncbi:unnamed protein product, partial [Laminaria digitata]